MHQLAINIYNFHGKLNNNIYISEDTLNTVTNPQKLLSSYIIERDKILMEHDSPRNFKGALVVKLYVCINQPSNIKPCTVDQTCILYFGQIETTTGK